MVSDYNIPEVGLNLTELYNSFWKSLPKELLDNIDFLLSIGKIVMIFVAIYFILLLIGMILKWIFGSRESRNLKRISEQLDEIIRLLHKGKDHRGKNN